LREWIARFNPDKEDLTWGPVWIRMYSLLGEYWDEGILKDIGNGLGEYIKAAEETKLRRYNSYAPICVFMRLDKALPDSVSLSHDDYEWIQPLDYEHVPFRCRKCHAHGHLFRDHPLNIKAPVSDPSNMSAQEGFTKVHNRKRAHKKPAPGRKPPQDSASFPSTSNSFKILAQTSEDQPLSLKPSMLPLSTPDMNNPSSSTPVSTISKDKKVSPMDIQTDSTGKMNEMEVDGSLKHLITFEENTDERSQPQMMEEEPENFDMEGLDLLELKQACKKKNYDQISEMQLNKLEIVLSEVYQQKQLGIQPSSSWDGSLPPRDFKKRGRRTELQRTIEVGKILVDSGRYAKLTKYYKPFINSES